MRVRALYNAKNFTDAPVLPNGPNLDLFEQNGPNLVLFWNSKYYLEVSNYDKRHGTQ